MLLYAEADATDVVDVLLLLNQLAARFKDALAPVMQEMVPACVARVHSLLPTDWDWSGAKCTPAALSTPTAAAAAGERPAGAGSTEDLRERAELQRAYYSFLHALVHNGLSGVLLRAPPGTLDAALGALMRGAATHVDAGAQRVWGRGWRGGACPQCHGLGGQCMGSQHWPAVERLCCMLLAPPQAPACPRACCRIVGLVLLCHAICPFVPFAAPAPLAGVRKTCVQAVERVAGEWCSAEGGEALPGFREFVMKQVRRAGRGECYAAGWWLLGCLFSRRWSDALPLLAEPRPSALSACSFCLDPLTCPPASPRSQPRPTLHLPAVWR